MPTAVVLGNNIYDENREKRLRGDAFECSQAFADRVLESDAEAERPARIAVIETSKRGRKASVKDS